MKQGSWAVGYRQEVRRSGQEVRSGGQEARVAESGKDRQLWKNPPVRLPRRASALLLLVGLVGGCGGGGSSSPTTPSPPPSGQPTLTIDASGVLGPKELVVTPGTRVLVTNRSTRARQVSSDPHPDHTDCPEINQVGFLPPNATKETGNLNSARTCGIHDHEDPSNADMRARIVIR
jgi:hypothetical protein